jgi:cell division ATPase FtsA
MARNLLLVDTGALINPDTLDALYVEYKNDGSNILKVNAVVNGVDITVKMITVNDLAKAEAAAAEYMSDICERIAACVDVGHKRVTHSAEIYGAICGHN